ncbi:hypothetical protein CLAC_04210 [Corynebacterium lactis RW2-5]|uniref:Uncharacterized protein n=1 Tax=Corynebacterium lactis RW2-5 TaxID=1408189 RepID=A0A0K2H362_9CORY|nr:hypothetical protein CLAC_04210 [Corynebacterium lactis RW2-5]
MNQWQAEALRRGFDLGRRRVTAAQHGRGIAALPQQRVDRGGVGVVRRGRSAGVEGAGAGEVDKYEPPGDVAITDAAQPLGLDAAGPANRAQPWLGEEDILYVEHKNLSADKVS